MRHFNKNPIIMVAVISKAIERRQLRNTPFAEIDIKPGSLQDRILNVLEGDRRGNFAWPFDFTDLRHSAGGAWPVPYRRGDSFSNAFDELRRLGLVKQSLNEAVKLTRRGEEFQLQRKAKVPVKSALRKQT